MTGQQARHPKADVAFAVAASAALTWYNNMTGRQAWHRRWYPAVNAGAAAAALAAAVASGLTPGDLGLRQDRLRSGIRVGALAAAPLTAAFGAAALTRSTRPLLLDERITGLTGPQLAYHVLVRIPVGTVAWEEIAFRGVLQAALRRVLSEPAATVTASAVFGAWHIRPTAEALYGNQLATGRAARIAAVAAIATGTAAGGAALSFLRDRSGSLAAPVMAHLAANCAGALASATAARLERRAGRRAGADPRANGCLPFHLTPALGGAAKGAGMTAVTDPTGANDQGLALAYLRGADPVLARVIDAHPDFDPKAWLRELPAMDPFGALIFMVTGQQLSVRSAMRILGRIQDLFGGRLPSPAELLGADPADLLKTGLSRRKVATLRTVADQFAAGTVSDDELRRMSDQDIIDRLTTISGVGPWTVHGLLIIALDRADVVLPGDLALRKAIQRSYQLDHLPSQDEVLSIAEPWRPYRSLATAYLFQVALDDPVVARQAEA